MEQAALSNLQVHCCVVGGGPAGMMLGFLLARAGVKVVVLEKHTDFLRDFRGDTIHPSTLELMHELQILQEFLKRPHEKMRVLRGQFGDMKVDLGDFTHLPVRSPFIAFMPQWEFLNFLAERGAKYPSFHVKMQTEAVDLIEEHGQVVGVRTQTPKGPLNIGAQLVVGADGRSSIVRDKGQLQVQDIGAPMDVLWMQLSRKPDDPEQPLVHVRPGGVFVMINRGDYWQCGVVIAKGSHEEVRRRGLSAFRQLLVDFAPFLHDRVNELADFADVKLLTVRVDRLKTWYRPGLLCIGDAAHAMSPIGGVGINLAVQDAMAAANILCAPLRNGSLTTADLEKVQRRRELPASITQRLQVLIQNGVIRGAVTSQTPITRPWPLRLMQKFPILRRVTARLIGIGVRPEHVEIPEILDRA